MQGPRHSSVRECLIVLCAASSIVFLCGSCRQRAAQELSALERQQLGRACGDDAERFRQRRSTSGDTIAATWPYTNHYNIAKGRCFVEISTTWDTTGPFRNHTLRIVYDAIEGTEVAKLETVTWFDNPAKADSPQHETFRVDGEEVPAQSDRLSDFRALMTK
jgi:hypothetical protein